MKLFVMSTVETKGVFGALRLKRETLKELSDMKKAFEISYQKEMSNDEFIRQLMAAVEGGDPAVWDAYCSLRELTEKLERKALERITDSENKG